MADKVAGKLPGLLETDSSLHSGTMDSKMHFTLNVFAKVKLEIRLLYTVCYAV